MQQNKPIMKDKIKAVQEFHEAFKIGLQHIDEVAAHYRNVYDASFDIEYYLRHYISYDLDEAKRKGLDLFLEHIKTNHYCTVTV